MTNILCRICYIKRNEYFTVNGDFREKVLKHLNLKINDNVLICKSCTEQLETFDQFFNEVHRNQEKFKQQQQAAAVPKDEIKYIILLKNNKTEILLKEVAEADDQLNLQDLPVQEEQLWSENVMQPGTSQQDDLNIAQPKEDQEDDFQVTASTIEGFPKELIKDGKLVVKGKELSKLIARFYRLECHECPVKKKFRKLSAMMNHFKNEHEVRGFVTCCGSKIVKIRQIANHMARHVQPQAFQCPTCNKMLTCPKILQYHIQNHLPESERNLACPEAGCDRRFSYQSALVTHSISHLPEEERTTFCCETCGRKFSTSSRLTTHTNTVHSKNFVRKEFSCDVCSKNFLCKSNLTYHLTTHKNFEFQVECPECKKWLKNKICLKKHLQTVHGENRHCCDVCDYSALNKQCLMNHKRVQHSDMKPFSCEICSQSFKLKNTLINHVNAQHNGLRKYSCEFCSKTFVSSGNYYSHRKRMHPEELSKKLKEKEIDEQRQRTEVQRRKLITN